MIRLGRAAAALAALLVAGSAAAQGLGGDSGPSHPIPYTQLVHRTAPPKAHRATARPRPRAPAVRAHPAAGQTSAKGAAPAGAPLALAPPPPLRPGARLAPGQAIPPAELEAFVDGAVRQAMAAGPLPGVAVSVVQDGQIVLEKGYGSASLSPVRPVDPRATLFRLGSVSKLFTWIAVAKAAEHGRLRPDQPINDLLPPALKLPDEGFARPVLVRHLMSHTAGFEDRELGRLFVDDPDRLAAPQDVLKRDRPRRVRPAGELSTYSNYGAALAGEALAEVERRPFDDAVEADVLCPLGLAHTSFREPYPARDGLAAPLPPALAQAVAVGHRWTARGLTALPFEYGQRFAPAVAASSTADDMARVMVALLNGGSVGGVQAWSPAVGAGLRAPLQRGLGVGVNGWAHGLMTTALPGGFTGYGHDGATLGSRARLTTAPDLRLGVFVAANSDTAGRLTEGLAERVVARFYAAPAAPPPGSPALAADAGAYDGTYVSSLRAYHGLEEFVDRLTRTAEVRVGGDGRVAVRLDGAGRLWAPTTQDAAPTRFRAADGEDAGPLRFELRDGRAVAFLPASGMAAYERVGWLHAPGALLIGALVAAGTSLLVLAGFFVRIGREGRRTQSQLVASLAQGVTALLWLGAILAFLRWRAQAGDAAALMFDWPGAWLAGASWAAVAATLLSVAGLVQLPSVWSEGRRVTGWSGGRKLRHSATVLVFLAFAALLAAWGALEPWAA